MGVVGVYSFSQSFRFQLYSGVLFRSGGSFIFLLQPAYARVEMLASTVFAQYWLPPGIG